MNFKHIYAVFKAEYYTTTAKFRKYRSYIPFLFILGVIGFSYILRLVYTLFRGDELISNPPIPTFFSIIAIFSYFTLFAPLLSPLGRVVYDGGARSRREVALNAPVEAKDLLYGNLLSNLAFFLPFFGFVGTLTLAPFIGNGSYSPLVTSLALFGILSLLILVGLVAGTLISPLVFNFISSRKNSQVRAIVAFAVSAMLIFSLPILRYFLENATLDSNLGWITYLPFTLAAVLIIYVLYGVTIGTTAPVALGLLLLYIIIIFILGYFTADTLYNLDHDQNEIRYANPNSHSEKVLDYITKPFPNAITAVVKSTMKASVRNIEHLARMTIGLSITVFMIFALSSRGLFRGATNFDDRIELAVIIFALVLSSASVIFIEASSFTIQHRDMFALIKSAPDGAKKFVVGKAIQMVMLLVPVFSTMIISLSMFNFISRQNILPLIGVIFLVLTIMTTLSLAIHFINPTDNEEDLGNFINLLIFYFISFLMASVPVIIVIGDFQISVYLYMVVIVLLIILSGFFLQVAAIALDQMNLETLDSDLSRNIIHGVKVISLFILTWNILPLFALTYFVRTQDAIGFLLVVYLIIVISVVIYYRVKGSINFPAFNRGNIKKTSRYLIGMLFIGVVFSIIQFLINPNISIVNIYTLLPLHPLVTFSIIFIVVVIEEFYFRGMLLDYSMNELQEKYAILLTSIIFAIFHFLTIVSFLNSLIQAIILGYLKTKTDSVFYPILAHLSYNSIFFAFYLLY